MKNATEGLVGFLLLPHEEKLHGFQLLRTAGELVLLELQKSPKDPAARFNSLRIATELLEVTKWMGHTKAYDTSEFIKKNYELAFKLAYKYYDESPRAKLIPFVVDLLYYEQFKTQSDSCESNFKRLYKACLSDLLKTTKQLSESESPWYEV